MEIQGLKVLPKTHGRVDLLEVIRYATEAAVEPERLLDIPGEHVARLAKRQRPDLHLRRPASEQRAFSAEHLAFHEALVAPAQHEEQQGVLQIVINKNLKD